MKCPKCQHNMDEVQTSYGEIERCSSCKGLWIEAEDRADMIQIAKDIDIGDEDIGEAMNQIDSVMCPTCPNSEMLRLVDPQQPHIWYESCPTCYGHYFDAGEFKDLSDHSLFDILKRFTIKERK